MTERPKTQGTRVYGASDDLIEFEGDVTGEVGWYGSTQHQDAAALVMCSDGSLFTISYGKADLGIWCLTLVHAGSLFERIDVCDDEDASIYSDIAVFRPGLRWAHVAKEWEKVS